jgi:hypothetical protein
LVEGEGGKWKRGRPKKKWEEAVTADVRMLGIEVLDSVMGCDLGNICAKAER